MTSAPGKIIHHLRHGTWRRVAGNLMQAAAKRMDRGGLVLRRDVFGRLRHGPGAPRYCEWIWVDPRTVDRLITNEAIQAATGMHRNRASGMVIDWTRIPETLPLMEQPKMMRCLRHWREGVSWEELGYIDFMATTIRHKRWTREQIVERFRELDEAFEETRRLGCLKTRKELDPRAFREEDGIMMHIGPGGQPFFGGNGFHRLAMAKALELERIPACVGVVDCRVLPCMERFRVTGKEAT